MGELLLHGTASRELLNYVARKIIPAPHQHGRQLPVSGEDQIPIGADGFGKHQAASLLGLDHSLIVRGRPK